MDKIFGSKYAKTIGMIAISMMMTVSCVQDNTSRTTDSGIAAIITGAVVFIMGLIEGITNPKACNVRR